MIFADLLSLHLVTFLILVVYGLQRACSCYSICKPIVDVFVCVALSVMSVWGVLFLLYIWVLLLSLEF